jgi:glucosamine-6-phosphate isomerase
VKPFASRTKHQDRKHIMTIETGKDYAEISAKAASIILQTVKERPDALLCFPAGDSPAGTFRELRHAQETGMPDFTRCRFVGLDEWAGIAPEAEGSCRGFLDAQVFKPLGIPSNRIVFFDALARDLAAECERIDSFLSESGPLDLIFLGMGMNGHLGLNEPGTPFDTASRVVRLDPLTAEVGQKYFSRKTELKLGITLGMKHIMDARRVVLLISGEKKAAMARKAIGGEVTAEIPASILQRHRNCTVLLDSAAASLL